MQIFASQYFEKEEDGKQVGKIYLSNECDNEREHILEDKNSKHITENIEKTDENTNQSSFKNVCKKGFKSARAHLIRQKTEQFINQLFWHSMLMTLTTPLAPPAKLREKPWLWAETISPRLASADPRKS